MVAQDSPNSEDLDNTTVPFGQQNSEKENFEKINYENLFKQESSSEEEMSYNYPGKAANETPNTTEHPGENIIHSEQKMWFSEAKGKTAFGGQVDEKNNGQNLIKKESGEEELFCPNDKNSDLQDTHLTTHYNPLIDQEMDCNTTAKNDETSETSNGDSEKENFR